MSRDPITRRSMIAGSVATVGATTLAGPRAWPDDTEAVTPADAGVMRAALITAGGEPVAAHVRLVDDHPRPLPGPGELLVRTRAAALNHLDLWVGRRLDSGSWVSGSDACGTVEALGDGVDRAWLGRSVIFNAAVPVHEPPLPGRRPSRPPRIELIGASTPGAMADLFTAPAANLVDVGDTDPVEAAAFALTHLTAWRMLVTRARVTPDQVALVTGIGGGVALAALAILRELGCRVIVTSRHQDKLDRARGLGADQGVLDEGQDWSERVRELTGGGGVDVVVDSVGAPLHGRCLASLAQGGTLVTCGATAGSEATTHLSTIYWNQLSVLGSSMGDMDELRQVTALLLAGRIRPVVDAVFEPADVAAAYARLESGRQFGKVVVRWST